jgi:hypothetical protein
MRGVKDEFLLLWPHGLKSGVTGQTGDHPRLSQRALIGFSDPPSVEPTILIKFNRGLIGRTDVPSVIPILFFLFEIFLLKTSPNIL